MNKTGDYHEPVMLPETLEGLAIKSSGIYVDCTVGGGGHFRTIAKKLDEKGILVGLDRDREALSWAQSHLDRPAPRIVLEQSRFSQLEKVLRVHQIEQVDGILMDLGVSSHQIDQASRGFSYTASSPLDMRMNPEEGQSAAQLLNAADQRQLTTILAEYGEIHNPDRMATAIRRYASQKPLRTSDELRACLEKEYGGSMSFKALAKLFQALRIAVNEELGELRAGLDAALRALRTGGRLAVLSYHSLEDRMVKNFMRTQENPCICPPAVMRCQCGKRPLLKRINRKAIKPRADEVARNSRARSARLRIAEKRD